MHHYWDSAVFLGELKLQYYQSCGRTAHHFPETSILFSYILFAAPNAPPRGPFNPNLLQNGAQKNPINFPPHGQMPSRPHVQQQQQRFNQIPRGRVPLPQNNSRVPLPMTPPTSLNNLPFSRPNVPAATAVMAAQIMQQQLLQHAARAQALQAAQAIHQQQQQNLLRTQMQAAMAQAYVRGHAAKAMMYNPRAVASSLQAVAQQMGLRAPQPQGKPGNSIPSSMMNQLKPEEIKESDGKASKNFMVIEIFSTVHFHAILSKIRSEIHP